MNTINPSIRTFSTENMRHTMALQTATTEETSQQEITEKADLASGKPAQDLDAEKLKKFATTQAVTDNSEFSSTLSVSYSSGVESTELQTVSELSPSDTEYIIDVAHSTGVQTASSMIPSANGITIRLLFTDDLHGSIFSSPMWGKPDVQQGGMSMLKTAIDENRDENTLLLDAGDWAQGTYAGGMDQGTTVVDLMGKMGYDAAAIGNHEFDWGRTQLTKLAEQAAFDVLDSNVLASETGEVMPGVAPHTIKVVNGVKVGIIGVTTQDTPNLGAKSNTEGVTFADTADSIKKSLPDLNKQGAEVLVLLSHCATDEDIKLATAVPELDVIIGGHDHEKLDEPIIIGKTIITKAGPHAKTLGQLDLVVPKKSESSAESKGMKSVSSEQTLHKPTPSNKPLSERLKRGPLPFKHTIHKIDSEHVQPNAEFDKELAPIAAKVDEVMSVKVGSSTVGITRDKFTPESTAGNIVTDSMIDATGADIAFLNTGAMKKAIDKGEIKFGDVFNLLPYDNQIVTVDMTGASIMKVLEESAGNAETIPVKGSTNIIQFAGLRATFDPSQPQGHRVSNVTVGGQPIDLGKTYSVASIDYLVSDSNEFPGMHEGTNKQVTEFELRDTVHKFIQKNSPLDESIVKIDGRQGWVSIPK